MQDSISREKVLKKIRKALINKSPSRSTNVDWDKNIYVSSNEAPEVAFAQSFSKIGGKFIYCNDDIDFFEKLVSVAQEKSWKNFYCWEDKIKGYLETIEFPFTTEEKKFEDEMVGLTLCEALVSRTGSVFVSSRQAAGRRLPVIGSTHAVVAFASQIVPDIKDALAKMKTSYNGSIPSMMTLITGPSRTADIEKTLVTGAHGPKEIFVFLIDDTE
jgi:L-lactate dehydrogenase complex protein LldG